MGNKNLELRIRAAIYSLKREYGDRIDIYNQESATADPATGVRTVESTVTTIRRAAVLPADVARREFRGSPVVSASGQLLQGGWLVDTTHVFVIDKRDARTLVLNASDWIVYEQKRCSIAAIQVLPCNTGWIVQAKALMGDTFVQIHQLSAGNTLDLSEETDASESELG